MEAKCQCPDCGKISYTDCEGCIKGGILVHKCKDKKEVDVYEVEWKIIEIFGKQIKPTPLKKLN